MKKKFLGFTLGEVLIALGVIGVVASLTLPQVINGKKASESHARFTTAYAMLAQAIDTMETDDVSIKPTTYDTGEKLYNAMKPYFKITNDCGTSIATISSETNGACHPKPAYKIANIASNTAPAIVNGAGFVTNNGMLIIISRHIQTTIFYDFDPLTNEIIRKTQEYPHLYITVDINGANKLPNRWGWDVFTFELTNDGLIAPGSNEQVIPLGIDSWCNRSSGTNSWNGLACAKQAISNSDYFRELFKGH